MDLTLGAKLAVLAPELPPSQKVLLSYRICLLFEPLAHWWRESCHSWAAKVESSGHFWTFLEALKTQVDALEIQVDAMEMLRSKYNPFKSTSNSALDWQLWWRIWFLGMLFWWPQFPWVSLCGVWVKAEFYLQHLIPVMCAFALLMIFLCVEGQLWVNRLDSLKSSSTVLNTQLKVQCRFSTSCRYISNTVQQYISQIYSSINTVAINIHIYKHSVQDTRCADKFQTLPMSIHFCS